MSDTNKKTTTEKSDFELSHESEIKKSADRATIDYYGKKRSEEEIQAEEEFQKKLRPESERNVSAYDVKGVNLNDEKAKKKAIEEMLEAQDAYCLQMSDLMNQDLNYKTLGGESKEAKQELSQRLKAYNDAYTMTMLSSCYTPLSYGVSAGSLLATSFNRKAIEAANPDMKMDSSRFWANMSQQMLPVLEKNKVLKPFTNTIRKYADEKSRDDANTAIAEKLRENDFDSLVMTPRQVAILKVNFMEQYYVDMRSQDPSSKDYVSDMNKLRETYDKSMKHLQAVSENSGFDMSVVAAEERYFVGLKMQSNPEAHYENIFDETYSVYGAAPNVKVNADVGTDYSVEWDGDFVTADEHSFTAEYGDHNGSFTVREPIVTYDQKKNFEEGLKRQGEQYASMLNYLDSDDCPCDKKVKSEAKRILEAKYEDYKSRAARVTMDDWGYDQKAADKYIKGTFGAAANNAIDCEHINDDFKEELNRVVEKQAFRSQGIDIFAEKVVSGQVVANGRDRILNEYKDKSKKYYTHRGETDNRSLEKFSNDVVNNWIESLDAHELVSLMSHTGTNMEQSYQLRGSTSRVKDISSSEELGNMALDKGNSRGEHGKGGLKSEREIPDISTNEPSSEDQYD